MRLSIATRIFIAFTAMLLTFAAVLGFTVRQMRAMYDDAELIHSGYVPLSLTLNDTKGDLRAYAVVLAEEDLAVLHKTLKASRSLYDFPEQTALKLRHCDSQAARLLRAAQDDADRASLGVLIEDLQHARALNDAFHKDSDRFAAALATGDHDEARALQSSLQRQERRLETQVRRAHQRVRDAINRTLQRAQRTEARSFGAIVALSLVALLLSASIMLATHLNLRPLRRLTEGVKRIAGGDYSPVDPVRTRDEVGLLAREFNTMALTLSDRDTALREQAAALEAANADLIALRNFNADILNSVQSAILTIDPEGHVTSANSNALALLGLEPSRLGDQRASRLPAFAELDQLDAQLDQVVQRAVAIHHEAVPIAAAGGGRFDVYLLPLRSDDAARGRGALLVLDDVTERVRTKEALIKSERLAAIGELATKVTHELRNPLSTIRLNAELLDEELQEHGIPHDSDPLETLRSLTAEVERLTALTEEYLRFARLPDPKPVVGDLNALVESVVDFQRDELEWAGIDVALQLDDALPPLPLDANQLRRALINLIRNAREAMTDPGDHTLTVTTRFEPDAHAPHALLTVHDTGCGIDPEAAARVFEPFFSTKGNGTGLGLPLTLQIVEEHGGALTCASAPGQGTTFRITLPIPT